jgi:hypothetical protein
MSDASDRLAKSRLAIVEHVHRRKHGSENVRAEMQKEQAKREVKIAAGAAEHAYDRAKARGHGWFGSVKRAAGAWWRHHPAHLGVELATPMLASYAARRPVVYLGAAAVLGAVIVVTRPWRLISATGLIVAIVKSSQLSSMVMSAMSGVDFDGEDRPYK